MVYTNYSGPKRIVRAKELRRVQTPAEKLLWEKLRAKRLSGYKFRRQHVIFDYIVDFYCADKKLVIEIDGEYHKTPEQEAKDHKRDMELHDKRCNILRFTNSQVINNMDDILKQILETLTSLPSVINKQNYKTSPSHE